MVTRKQEKLFSFRKLFFIHILTKKMILETVSASLLTGVVAAVGLSFVRNEPLPSLQVDEHGKRNPMLPYWIVLSIVTRRNCLRVGILHGRRVSSNPTSRRSFRRLVGKYDLHRQ